MYSDCSRFHPNRFTFGGVIAERVNTAKSFRKVNPIFGWILASSRSTKLRFFGFPANRTIPDTVCVKYGAGAAVQNIPASIRSIAWLHADGNSVKKSAAVTQNDIYAKLLGDILNCTGAHPYLLAVQRWWIGIKYHAVIEMPGRCHQDRNKTVKLRRYACSYSSISNNHVFATRWKVNF